jgi:hypothetical protein
MMSEQSNSSVEYVEYSSTFSKTYVEALNSTLYEIKNFCVQMATAYGIIYIEKCKNIPRIKAVVYCPTSDTYYVHTNDEEFSSYLLPRLKKFFLTPQFGFEDFTLTCDEIDQDKLVLEVNVKDESTIINNGFFKVPLISL